MERSICLLAIVPIILGVIFAIMNSDNATINSYLVQGLFSRFKDGVFCLQISEANDKIIAYGADLPTQFIQGAEIKSNEICSYTMIVLNRDEVYSGFLRGTIGIGETYFRKQWTYDKDKEDLGDMMTFIFWNILNTATPYTRYIIYFSLNEWKEYFRMIGLTLDTSQDVKDLNYHYYSHEFFSSMLGESMTYSCPQYNLSTKTLYDAQTNKWDILIHKLSLPTKSKYNLLDVGSGWGFFASYVYNKSNGNANVTAITPVNDQYAYQLKRFKHGPNYQLMHYRSLLNIYGEGFFDRIISTGMISHLANEKLNEFMEIMYKLVKPGGYFVLQGVVATSAFANGNKGWIDREYACTSSNFIYKYTFPGGCLPLHDWVHESGIQNGFISMHRELLGQHYSKVLREWRFGINKDQRKLIEKNIVTEKVFLSYDMYLAQSEAGYRIGKFECVQFVFYKPEVSKIHTKKFNEYGRNIKLSWQ